MKTETTQQTAIQVAPAEDDLRQLGFTTAADNMTKDRALAKKLRTAFEHFRVVTPEIVTRFNETLKKNTLKNEGTNQWGQIYTHDKLQFTPVESYSKVPPSDVLSKIREAKNLGCFDKFEVATIASVRVIPDPIIFGRIDGSDNRYFIAQWDTDISIEDILRPEEG